MTTKEIRDKVEDVYIKETGRFAFLDENKLDDRYVEWLENQVMNNFVLDPVISYCELNSGEVIKEGDEYKIGENWKPVEHSIGYEYVKGSYKPTRRKCNC
jgi:hypothetical protein